MDNNIAKDFTFFSLIKFAFPNIVMMVFLSMYVIVDGIFVSRFVGTTALSAVNMIYPLVSIQMAICIMFASGGSAIIAKKFGEKKEKEARQNFSLIVLVVVLIGILFAIFGNVFIEEILHILGVSNAQYELCRSYAVIILMFAPAFFLQTAFQTFFVTAGKPTIGLICTIAAGISNIVFDYLFIVVCNMGIAGAAWGTGIGYCIPAVCGLIFFTFYKKGTLNFTKPKIDMKVLIKACTNGSSEMVTNLSNAVTTFIFNYSFMKYYGVDGVAAITIVLYFQYVFTAIYFGFSMGIAPIISYKYGAKDNIQLKKIFKSSIVFLIITAVVVYSLSNIFLYPALSVFTKPDTNVFKITLDGFKIVSIGYLFMSINIYSSTLFTAFSDGMTSAIISFSRTFVFLVGAVLILPIFLEKMGVWISMPVAEILGLFVSIIFLVSMKSKYNY